MKTVLVFRPLLALLWLGHAALTGGAAAAAKAPADLPPGGNPVLAPHAALTTPVGGLERTRATAQVVEVAGSRMPFRRALRVRIGANATETNATQLTVRNAVRVEKGDALLASFFLRGASAVDGMPARAEFLFEKATDPWTKSVSQGVAAAAANRATWKRIVIPFAAAEPYAPGEAMASIRLAFGPQTVEIGGLEVVSYGKTRAVAELVARAAQSNPLGTVTVAVRRGQTRQTLRGFGGNFAQPRYGSDSPMDAVGDFNLRNLRVVHARVGIPLNHWTPQKDVYNAGSGPARAALLQMQVLARRRIPITGSIWEGPAWLLPGTPETSRTLPPERYGDAIEAILRFLVTARDEYGAHVRYVSFNEPDYGVNFRFTPAEMAAFIRQAGPRFAAAGLKTRFLTGDTANAGNFADYARPLLRDKTIAPYLGPLAFHSWDALGALESHYTAIAVLGRQYRKPVWCTEAGHDAQLWQQPDPWGSWENALRTALAYERTLRLSGAEQMDYWTYQDNYPLVSKDGARPFPVWQVVRQMEEALPPGSRVAAAVIASDDLKALPVVGPKPGQFSVLLVNPVGPGTAVVTGLPRGASVSVVRSDAARRRVATAARVDGAGRLSVTLPARSVVTVRSIAGGSGAQDAPRRPSNRNGS